MIDKMNSLIKTLITTRDVILSSESFEIAAEKLQKKEIAYPILPRYNSNYLKIDLHSHTCHSDGLFDYKQIVWWAKFLGLEAIAITDHDNLSESITEAISEGKKLNCDVIPGLEYTIDHLDGVKIPGLEYTIDHLDGVKIPGLEIGVLFFPSDRFTKFLQSSAGKIFCDKFKPKRLAKTVQAHTTLENVNENFLKPLSLPPISKEELYHYSGNSLPICASTITLPVLKRIGNSKNEDLNSQYPNTRSLWAHFNKNRWIPPLESGLQTFSDLIDIKKELKQSNLSMILSLNHPEEILSKGAYFDKNGELDDVQITSVFEKILRYSSELNFHFIERYTPRTNKETNEIIDDVYKKVAPHLIPIASSDSHRISGELDELNNLIGWIDGEDFITGIGKITSDFPSGNLKVPNDYFTKKQLMNLFEDLTLSSSV